MNASDELSLDESDELVHVQKKNAPVVRDYPEVQGPDYRERFIMSNDDMEAPQTWPYM